MKFRLTTVIVFSLLLAGPAFVEAKNDREQAGLLGPVKTVLEVVGPAERGGTGVLFRSATYPIDGMETGNESGIINRDSTHGTIEKSIAIFDPKKKTREFLSYTYVDADGTDHPDGLLTGKQKETFDNHGNLTKREIYEINGAIKSSHEFRYDSQGSVIQSIDYRADGSIDSAETHTITYDKQAHPIMAITRNKDSNITGKIIVKYDASGHKAEQSVYETDGSLAQHFRYDEVGREVEQTIYDTTHSHAEKRTMQYEESDSTGNWTKMTQTLWGYENGSLNRQDVLLITRTITYY